MTVALTIMAFFLAIIVVLGAVIYAMREGRIEDEIDNITELWRWPPL